MERRPRVHHIDKDFGVPSDEDVKIDYTQEIGQLYRILYKPNADSDSKADQHARLREFILATPLTQERYDVLVPVLKAHLIKEEWEHFIQKPIQPGTELQSDEFFWSDFMILVYHSLRKSQAECEGSSVPDADASPTVLALRYLRQFDSNHQELQEKKIPFVIYHGAVALIGRFFEAIEQKYIAETNQSLSGEEFYTAATHPDFSKFLLALMYNDRPSVVALMHVLQEEPDDIDRFDNPMNLADLERDPQTNVVTFSHDYVRRVQGMIASGAVARADKQVSCPVAHVHLIQGITEWMGAVAAYYRFQRPLPEGMQLETDLEKAYDLNALMKKYYAPAMSNVYRAARGISSE